MDYVLENLLRVRQHRKDAAGSQVRAKSYALENADRLVQQTRQQLDEYVVWRVKTEDTLYEEVKSQQISLKELDDLKIKVLLLREKQTFLEKELFEARSAREAAEKKLDEARKAYQEKQREMMKIEEHKKIWLTETRKQQELSREKEMEEFRRHNESINEDVDDVENY